MRKNVIFYIFVPSEFLTSVCFPSGETNWSQKFTIPSYVCSHVSHQICIFTAFWNHTGNLGLYDLVRDRPTDERTISAMQRLMRPLWRVALYNSSRKKPYPRRCDILMETGDYFQIQIQIEPSYRNLHSANATCELLLLHLWTVRFLCSLFNIDVPFMAVYGSI